ncbi:MAG: hypothetical protein IPH53_04465 [Flavobacteriales bacterium]|nr:hypothetical protein [Flavobacteriales bacterium]
MLHEHPCVQEREQQHPPLPVQRVLGQAAQQEEKQEGEVKVIATTPGSLGREAEEQHEREQARKSKPDPPQQGLHVWAVVPIGEYPVHYRAKAVIHRSAHAIRPHTDQHMFFEQIHRAVQQRDPLAHAVQSYG